MLRSAHLTSHASETMSEVGTPISRWMRFTARAGNRRFRRLSALRAHTKKVPCKMDFHRETLRALNRPKSTRTVRAERVDPAGGCALSEKGVRLAQKTQVGPCIPAEMQL